MIPRSRILETATARRNTRARVRPRSEHGNRRVPSWRAPGFAATAVVAAIAVASFAGRASAATPISIVVHCAPFASADSAAVAEARVRWDDADHADDDACTESYAALELYRFLRRCPGVGDRGIVVRAGDRLPDSGDVIVLGNPSSQPLIRTLLGDALPDPGSRDAFRIRSIPQNNRTVWVVAGSSRSGTLYGAYALLERLGFRFYGPDDAETVAPRAATTLPTPIDVATTPAFEIRGFWAWEPRGNPAFFRWMARRRMNLWSAAERDVPLLRKLGIRLAGGGHSIQANLLSPRSRSDAAGKTYFEAHPEWYGLHDGKRSPNLTGESGDNFCTSNPAAVAELARNLVRSLEGGRLAHAELVNVWPLDGGRWCECDACRAIGTPTDRILDLVRRLDQGLREARRRGVLHRDVTLVAPAYLETFAPPTRAPADPTADASVMVTWFPYFRCYAHTLDDPNCSELNRRIQTSWIGWTQGESRAYRGPIGVGEYYNVSWFKTLPLVFPHVMAHDIATAHAAGARWFSYMHAPTSLWGPWRLDHLVLSEALWQPGFDVDSLVADYCARVFPSAPREMSAYYRRLETASANIFAIEITVGGVFQVAGHPGGRLTVPSMQLYPYAHLPGAPGPPATLNAAPGWGEILAAMDSAGASLARAARASRDSAELRRFRDDRRRYDYGRLTFALFDRMLRLARADRGDASVDVPRALAEADSLARRLSTIRDLVHVAGAHSNARDGLDASHMGPALEYFRARFGARTPSGTPGR